MEWKTSIIRWENSGERLNSRTSQVEIEYQDLKESKTDTWNHRGNVDIRNPRDLADFKNPTGDTLLDLKTQWSPESSAT